MDPLCDTDAVQCVSPGPSLVSVRPLFPLQLTVPHTYVYMVHAWRDSFGGHDSVFGVSPHTIVYKVPFHVSCHVMSCLSRPPSHCGSDGAVHFPPHHSPVCCHLSHQGHTTAPTFAHATWTPPHISTLSRVLFVCDELVHLIDCMTVFLSHPFPSPSSLTPARPSQLTLSLPTILQHSTHPPI